MQGVRALPARYVGLWPALRWMLFGLALLFVVGVLAGAIPYGHGVMGDGSAFYYSATPYDWTDSPVPFRYSPAFWWAIQPLRWLSWEGFTAVWAGLHVAAGVAWLSPWMLAFPGVADDVISGNISTFLAVAVVLAVRHPASWAFVLLTKVTPGVGILLTTSDTSGAAGSPSWPQALSSLVGYCSRRDCGPSGGER